MMKVLVAFCLLAMAAGITINEANDLDISSISTSSTNAMEHVFLRSHEAHTNSMASIMKSMTLNKAMEVLQKNNLTTPGLMQVANMAFGRQGNLRKQTPQSNVNPDKYGSNINSHAT